MLKKLFSSQSAVSTVVSVVLLLGIIVSVITVINAYYVPEWKSAAEKSHMDDVYSDMADMKKDIDIVSAYMRTGSPAYLSLSVPIRAGGGDLPIFSADRSSGRLVINEENNAIRIDVNNGEFFEDLNPGSITYVSDNMYFVNQKYTYENGAVILSQKENSLMRLSPQMVITKVNSSTIRMDISIIEINSSKRSVTSNSIEEIRFITESSKRYSVNASSVSLEIETSYPRAWNTFFENSALENDIEWSPQGDESPVVFSSGDLNAQNVSLNVTKTTFYVNLNVLS